MIHKISSLPIKKLNIKISDFTLSESNILFYFGIDHLCQSFQEKLEFKFSWKLSSLTFKVRSSTFIPEISPLKVLILQL